MSAFDKAWSVVKEDLFRCKKCGNIWDAHIDQYRGRANPEDGACPKCGSFHAEEV